MAKAKTHKGLKKRVKLTAKGKVKRKKAFTGHLMSSKNSKRRRRLTTDTVVENKAMAKTIRTMLGK